MSTTPKFGIGLMASGSLQKEVIFNEATILLEVLTARSVRSRALNQPPANPGAGDTYLITDANPLGDWAGKSGSIAFWYNGWRFVAPPAKMRVWVEDVSAWWTFSAGNWTADPVGAVRTLDDLSDVTISTPLNGQVLAYDAASQQWKPRTGSTVVNFGDLADVVTTGVKNGQVFAWDTETSKLVPHDLPVIPDIVSYDHIGDLKDVDLSGIQDGEVLLWNSKDGKFEAGVPSVVSLNDVNDVVTTGAKTGDVLCWNGAAWGPSSRAMLLSFLNVVDGPRTYDGAAHKLLRVDATESELEYVDPAEISLPGGGTAGQVLVKTATGSGWAAAPVSVPAGGKSGQVLAKLSDNDGETVWVNVAAGSGGTGGSGIVVVGAWAGTTLDQFDTFDGLTVPADYTYVNQKGSALEYIADVDPAVNNVYAVQLGDVGDSQNTYIEFPASADETNNKLQIWYRQESEGGWDRTLVYVDGTVVLTINGENAGASYWHTATVTLAVGNHTVRILYGKDSNGSTGWDNIRFSRIRRPVANTTGYNRGSVVKYKGSYWLSAADANRSEPGADDAWLPFVPRGGTAGQVLAQTAAGLAWVDQPTVVTALSGLSDVLLDPAPQAGQVLTFDAATSKWKASTVAVSSGGSSGSSGTGGGFEDTQSADLDVSQFSGHVLGTGVLAKQADGAIVITGPVFSGWHVSGAGRAAPSGDFSFKARVGSSAGRTNSLHGLYLAVSDGSIYTFALFPDLSPLRFTVHKWNSWNSVNGMASSNYNVAGDVRWVRVDYVAATRVASCLVSADGVNWFSLTTVTLSTAPSFIGVCAAADSDVPSCRVVHYADPTYAPANRKIGGASTGEVSFSAPTLETFTMRRAGASGSIAAMSNSRGVRLVGARPASNQVSTIYAAVATAVGATGKWRATARLRRHSPTMNYVLTGMMVRGSDGKIRSVSVGNDKVIGFNATNYSADDTWLVAAGVQPWPDQNWWQRVTFDGTNLVWSVSADGDWWEPILTEPATTYLASAPAQVGVLLVPNGNGVLSGVNTALDVLHWAFEAY